MIDRFSSIYTFFRKSNRRFKCPNGNCGMVIECDGTTPKCPKCETWMVWQ